MLREDDVALGRSNTFLPGLRAGESTELLALLGGEGHGRCNKIEMSVRDLVASFSACLSALLG